jgi:3'(2'), 5'-bisphosphate nucleotidase
VSQLLDPAALPDGLRERKRQATHQRIADEAARLAQEKGLAAITIDEIAKAADIGRATFFRYFDAKEVAVAEGFTVPWLRLVVEGLLAQPPGLDAMAAVRQTFQLFEPVLDAPGKELVLRQARLSLASPGLQAWTLHVYVRFEKAIADAVAGRFPDLREDDPRPRLVGALTMSAVRISLDTWLAADGAPGRPRHRGRAMTTSASTPATSSPLPPLTDSEVARDLATSAGELLLELRDAGLEGKDLKDTGDRESHLHLMAELARLRPDDAVLSEEGARDPARLTRSRVWVVDPVDGTREYSEPGRDDWAVHVALCVDGTATIGAVALPARGITLSTAGGLPSLPPYDGKPRLAVSRTRPPAHAEALAAELDGELVPMGSAGAKAMAVVLGEIEVYAHSGGQYEWDSAAPVAVAAAAGLHVSRLDGSPLVYNREDPYLPDLLVCRPEYAAVAIEVCNR